MGASDDWDQATTGNKRQLEASDNWKQVIVGSK